MNIFFQFHVTNERLRLYFYAGKITNFPFTYEKVNKTNSLKPFGCNGPLAIKALFCVTTDISFSALRTHFLRVDSWYHTPRDTSRNVVKQFVLRVREKKNAYGDIIVHSGLPESVVALFIDLLMLVLDLSKNIDCGHKNDCQRYQTETTQDDSNIYDFM